MILFGSSKLARQISRKLQAEYSELLLKRFPDGELYLRLKKAVRGKKVVLVQSFVSPDLDIIKTLFAAHTAKELGARKIVLVAPYLPYMRQDTRFHSGECISSRVMAELLRVFDEIITIDPHLHRIRKLGALFKNPKRLSANALIAEYIHRKIKNPLIIGPDEESFQWAEKIAEKLKSHAVVLRKRRYTSRKVRIKIRGVTSLENRNVVIVDDIISTGHTMIETVKEARRLGGRNITCVCVHGIFAESAYQKLRHAGARQIISTNTITHRSNKIDVAGLLEEALK